MGPIVAIFFSLAIMATSSKAGRIIDDTSQIPCSKMNEACEGCINLKHCSFAKYNNSETRCVEKDKDMATIGNLVKGFALMSIYKGECPKSSEDELKYRAVPPNFEDNSTTTTTLDLRNSTTVPTTTLPPLTTPQTTTESTTKSTDVPTTSPTTATTTETTSTTTKFRSTTEPSVTSGKPYDPDSGKSTSNFDGWSFFGGILLTIGLSAIGFISFKYYKVRNASGGNYSPF